MCSENTAEDYLWFNPFPGIPGVAGVSIPEFRVYCLPNLEVPDLIPIISDRLITYPQDNLTFHPHAIVRDHVVQDSECSGIPLVQGLMFRPDFVDFFPEDFPSKLNRIQIRPNHPTIQIQVLQLLNLPHPP